MSNLNDGNVSWIGGMDSSRHPTEIADIQYSNACNLVIPDSFGGIKVRPGIHNININFNTRDAKRIYETGTIRAQGWFESNGITYLIVLVDGYVMRMTRALGSTFKAECVNLNSPNAHPTEYGWVITIPNGCIVNNGMDFPLFITATTQRRLDPAKGELSIGRMGVYMHGRLFYVDQSAKQILASDFMQPTKFTLEGTNIFGFMNPDAEDKIVAIGKQKTVMNYAEGGNLIWSSYSNIYSADVRGPRDLWANLGTRIGKTTEVVPDFSAASSNSFESFNGNIYFRSRKFGLADLAQTSNQFNSFDSYSNQSREASYYFSNDTDWMLSQCYTRSCNGRLFTTTSPQLKDDGSIIWNGILSFNPSASYVNQGAIPRRFESVFTGVRPYGLTVVKSENQRDKMYIHSHDKDGINRLYSLEEDSDFDIAPGGQLKEIEGFIVTKGYNFKNPFMLKKANKRIYRLNEIPRSVSLCVYSRAESSGQWVQFWGTEHKIGRIRTEELRLTLEPTKDQTRSFVSMTDERFGECHKGDAFYSIQYRIEFKGPINLDSFIVTAGLFSNDVTPWRHEQEKLTLTYTYRPDYYYSII
jgi:hypothetical protein